MNPNTTRSITFRARKAAAGLSEVRGIFAKPANHKRIKEIVRELIKKQP
jgi:hypothetical protein